MKYKFNPLTGEFNIVPDSGTLIQKLNWLTGNFNLTKDASKYKQIYNAIEGEFNLRPATTQVIVHGVGSVQLTNAAKNGLLSLKAYGGTEQRSSLPSGYTQLEYVTFDRTYIDSGIIPTTFDYEIETKYKFNTITSGPNCARGYLTSTGGNIPRWLLASYSSSYLLNANTTSNITGADTNVHVFKGVVYEDDGTARWSSYIDGEQKQDYSMANPQTWETNSLPIYIGGRNNTGTAGNWGNGDLYYHKVTKAGVVIQHLIPCKRNSDNEVGLYDLVTNTFFENDGTGTITAGPNAAPTPAAPMDIVSNNGVLKVRHQSGLPLGYKKLLSIYNATNATLDTGIKLANTDRVETRFFNSSASQYGAWYGIYATGESSAFYANGTYYGYDAVNNKINTFVSVDTNGHDLVHDFVNGKLTLDGNDTLFTPFEFTNSVNNKLFCRYYNNSYGYNVKGWITYYKVYRNNVLIQDLIPCTRESDNTVGMYDLVSGTFIGPDEGYTFEEGTAATDPIEVYVDGTTETIWSHTKNLFSGTVEQGGLGDSSGAESQSSVRIRSTYIPVNPNTQYYLSWITNSEMAVNIRNAHFYDASNTWISRLNAFTFTTPPNAAYVRFVWQHSDPNTDITPSDISKVQLELGSTATTYVPYFDGGTATAEILLKVGDYVDEQEILSGNIIRKVGVKVLDGTEEWKQASTPTIFNMQAWDTPLQLDPARISIPSTHFVGTDEVNANMPNNSIKLTNSTLFSGNGTITIKSGTYDTLTDWKNWLSNQYNAGTPVIVLYVLAAPTTETVSGQPLDIPSGNSTIEITQASIDNLELEATYEQDV